jgi:hypothetical protein
MAYEVTNMQYFWPHSYFGGDSRRSPLSSDEELGTPDYDFRFNPLHDLESLWWVCLWFLAFHSPAGLERNFAHECWYNNLFVARSAERIALLHFPPSFTSLREALPEQFIRTSTTFSKMRRLLVSGYQEAEASAQMFNTAPFGDHEVPAAFVKLAKEALEEAPNVTFHKPEPPTEVEPERKRELGASTASTSGPPLKRAKTTPTVEE